MRPAHRFSENTQMNDNDNPLADANANANPADIASDAAATPPTTGTDPSADGESESGPARRSRRGRRGGGGGAGRANAAAPAEGAPDAPADAAPKPAKAPRQREVHPALETLFKLYPKMFGARFLPLKLGVFQDLLAAHPDDFKKDDLKIALGLHARSTRYLESVAAGLPRHDLQAQPVEPVSPEHVHHAILEVFRRRQLRAKNDLRPQLVAQIIAAVEASGLSPDDYAMAVRTPDEAASAALDEALGEVRSRSAKSVALVRAFDASGKSLAEFADMYGMEPAEVTKAVLRVRRQQQTSAA